MPHVPPPATSSSDTTVVIEMDDPKKLRRSEMTTAVILAVVTLGLGLWVAALIAGSNAVWFMVGLTFMAGAFALLLGSRRTSRKLAIAVAIVFAVFAVIYVWNADWMYASLKSASTAAQNRQNDGGFFGAAANLFAPIGALVLAFLSIACLLNKQRWLIVLSGAWIVMALFPVIAMILFEANRVIPS